MRHAVLTVGGMSLLYSLKGTISHAGRAVPSWLKFLKAALPPLGAFVAIFFSLEFPLLCGGLAARWCLYWQPQEANATVK